MLSWLGSEPQSAPKFIYLCESAVPTMLDVIAMLQYNESYFRSFHEVFKSKLCAKFVVELHATFIIY